MLKQFRQWLLALMMLASLVGANVVFAKDDRITLNMQDADMKEFITGIGQITGKTFIIDPRVKGSVTVISEHPMSKDGIYQVFISTLNVHGFAAVKANGVTKIVPIANVKKDAMKMASDAAPGRGDEYVTRVLQLDQVSAQEILPLVKPIIGKEAHVAAYPPSNVLIVIDRADNVKRIVKLLHKIDTASNDEVEIFSLKYAPAVDVVRILTQLEKPAARSKGAPVRAATYAADERTNSILLRGEPTARLRMKTVIAKLDTPMLTDTGNVKVIYLHNAQAVEVAKVLNGVKDNIVAQAPSSQVATGKQAGKAARSSQNGNHNQTSIQADEGTNALLISAAPDVMRSLELVIKQLDIRRAQVLVEAIIVEMGDQQSAELGVQWLGKGGSVGLLTSFPGASLNAGSVLGAVGGGVEDASVALAGAVGLNAGAGFKSGGTSLGVILNAIATDDDANILSTPSVITMDNEEASIVVGQEVPFITGSTTGNNNSNPFTTVTREKVGIKLQIKPQINEGDAVRLKIYQEVSSVSPATGATDLVTNQREIDTTVLVKDGATVVLGGLMSDEESQGEQKVPLLGDLPVVGKLFTSTRVTKSRKNLMVFLRPTIIRDDKALNEASGKKYSYIRKQQLALQEKGIALLPDEKPALLPAWRGGAALQGQ